MAQPSPLLRNLLRSGLTLAALALVALIQWGALENPITESAELAARDVVQQLTAKPSETEPVVMIDIDEASIASLGPWPWSRARIAELTQSLLDQGVQIVVLDMVLPSPRDADGDARLAELTANRKLVLAQVFDYVERPQPIISGVAAAGIVPPAGIRVPAVAAKGIVANHDGLANAPCVGNIGFVPDPDGKLRRLPLLTEWEGRLHPSLALATLDCLERGIKPGNATDGVQKLRFETTPESWTVIPAAQLLKRTETPSPIPGDLLKGRIAVIGSSALGLSDRVAIPLSPNISGMFVHAAAMSELLRDAETSRSVVHPMIFIVAGLALIAAMGMTIAQGLKARWLITLLATLLLVWLGLLIAGASQASTAHLTAPMWGFLFLGMTLIPIEWSIARAQVRATARLLSRYVAKPVLRDLLRRQDFNPLAPRAADITVLVADMADYSKITANQSLEATASITRRFLECITAPVWELQGTLDRYTGDGLVAFWGAPVHFVDQADRAIDAAKLMLARIDALNQEFRAEGLPEVAARIGIAGGHALVGDFGTQFRATYTAVGNCINTAARLEATAKDLHLQVVIAESVAEESHRHTLEPLGEQDVRGIGRMKIFTTARPIPADASASTTPTL